MTERINEFKLQAGIQDNPDQEGLDLFAELIVRRCATLIWPAWGPETEISNSRTWGPVILEHFELDQTDE